MIPNDEFTYKVIRNSMITLSHDYGFTHAEPDALADLTNLVYGYINGIIGESKHVSEIAGRKSFNTTDVLATSTKRNIDEYAVNGLFVWRKPIDPPQTLPRYPVEIESTRPPQLLSDDEIAERKEKEIPLFLPTIKTKTKKDKNEKNARDSKRDPSRTRILRPITSVFKNAGSLADIIKNQLKKEQYTYNPNMIEKSDMIFSTKSTAAAALAEEAEQKERLERLRLEKLQKEKEEAEQYAYQFLHTKPEYHMYPSPQKPESPIDVMVNSQTTNSSLPVLPPNLAATSSEHKEKKRHKHKEKHKDKHRDRVAQLKDGEKKHKDRKDKIKKDKKKDKKRHKGESGTDTSLSASNVSLTFPPPLQKPISISQIPVLKKQEPPSFPPKLEKERKDPRMDKDISKDLFKDKEKLKKRKEHRENKEGGKAKEKKPDLPIVRDYSGFKVKTPIEPPKLLPEQPITFIPHRKPEDKHLPPPKITESGEKKDKHKEKEKERPKDKPEKDKSSRKRPHDSEQINLPVIPPPPVLSKKVDEKKHEEKDDQKKEKDKKKDKEKRKDDEKEKKRDEETPEQREERRRLKKERKKREKEERKRKANEDSTESFQPAFKKQKIEEPPKAVDPPPKLKLKISLPFAPKPLATSTPIPKKPDPVVVVEKKVEPKKSYTPVQDMARPSSSRSSYSFKATPEKREKPPKIMSERVQLVKALKESMESALPPPPAPRLVPYEHQLDKSPPKKKKRLEFKESKMPMLVPPPPIPPNILPPAVIAQPPPANSPLTQADSDEKYWRCPKCGAKYRDGDDMVACERCQYWYHWHCVGLFREPEEEKWYCQRCRDRMAKKKQLLKP